MFNENNYLQKMSKTFDVLWVRNYRESFTHLGKTQKMVPTCPWELSRGARGFLGSTEPAVTRQERTSMKTLTVTFVLRDFARPVSFRKGAVELQYGLTCRFSKVWQGYPCNLRSWKPQNSCISMEFEG